MNSIMWNRYIVLGGSLILYLLLITTQLNDNSSSLAFLTGKCHQFLIDYKTLPNLIVSFGVFYFFLRSDFGHSKIINTLAKSSLTVYIVHQTPAFIPVLWNKLLVVSSWSQSNMITLFIVVSTVMIYIVVSAVNPVWELIKSRLQLTNIYATVDQKIQSLYSF